ncbi:hypothetical protein HGQ98_00785, partial [Achromobacter ruhlandii]|nr:hypothetical protein [Achromobacter ruhlandii]
MDSTIYLTLWAVLAFVSWLIVAGGAVLAVFSRAIKDTTFERIGLAAVSLTATGAPRDADPAPPAPDGPEPQVHAPIHATPHSPPRHPSPPPTSPQCAPPSPPPPPPPPCPRPHPRTRTPPRLHPSPTPPPTDA